MLKNWKKKKQLWIKTQWSFIKVIFKKKKNSNLKKNNCKENICFSSGKKAQKKKKRKNQRKNYRKSLNKL